MTVRTEKAFEKASFESEGLKSEGGVDSDEMIHSCRLWADTGVDVDLVVRSEL